MKTLITAIAFSLLSIGAFAQQKTAPAKPAAQKAQTVTYKCPVCGATSTKAGKCSKDKDVDMVKVGDYYCPDCYMSQSKPGKCPMCGVEMKKMEASSTKK